MMMKKNKKILGKGKKKNFNGVIWKRFAGESLLRSPEYDSK